MRRLLQERSYLLPSVEYFELLDVVFLGLACLVLRSVAGGPLALDMRSGMGKNADLANY